MVAIIALSVLRAGIAARYPLTADETYYWVWSKHLAYGYTDHPPMVAWLIALGSVFGNGSFAVRLPFIICEGVAAYAVGRAAMILSDDARAGTAAAITFLLIPQGRLAVGEALPDGPYIASWALALWFTAQVAKRSSPRVMISLGVALGAAILSRFFGWALVGGIVAFAIVPFRRALWKGGLWAALLIAAILYLPFVIWNANHHWANFAFTLSARQPLHGFSAHRIEIVTSLRFVILASILWIVAFFTILRPRFPLLAWTALPFVTLVALLSFFQTTESYWILGPLTSLCAAIGIAFARQPFPRKRAWFVAALIPAAYTLASAVFVALPESAQAWALHKTGGALKGPFFSQTFAFAPMSADVRRLSNASSAAVLTDRLEIASQLTYHGVRAVLAGGAPQVAQWTTWYGDRLRSRALIVTFDPLTPGQDFFSRIAASFSRTSPGPVLRYRFADTGAATFYTTWCEHPNGRAAVLLLGSSGSRSSLPFAP